MIHVKHPSALRFDTFGRSAAVLAIGFATFLSGAQTPRTVNGGHNPMPRERREAIDREIRRIGNVQKEAEGLLRKGSFLAAQRKAEEGLKGEVLSTGLQKALGESLLRQGKRREALAVFKSLNATQNDDGSYARIGLLLVQLGDVAGSRRMLNRELMAQYYTDDEYLRSLPASNNARSLEGVWRFTIGLIEDCQANDEDATLYYKQALAIYPKNPLIQLSLGKIYLRNGQYSLSAGAFAVAAQEGNGRLKDDAVRNLNISTARLGSAVRPTMTQG